MDEQSTRARRGWRLRRVKATNAGSWECVRGWLDGEQASPQHAAVTHLLVYPNHSLLDGCSFVTMRVIHAFHFTTIIFAISAATARPTDIDSPLVDFTSQPRLLYSSDGFDLLPAHERQPISHTIRTRPITVYRPESPADIEGARRRSIVFEESTPIQWNRVEVQGPDIEDRHTLAQLARMSGNSYALPGQKNWYELDEVWNKVR